MSRRLSALVILGAALLAGGPLERDARAEEPHVEEPATIAVVCAPGDRFGLRVLAELEALGFHGVLLEPAAEAASRSSLEVAARKAGAIAAIRAVPSERGVEVWIADRVTGKTVLREVASDGGAPDRDDALALRAVELLRASLLEIALPSAPPGEVPATSELREKMHLVLPAPSAPPLEPPSPPTLRLSVAPGALLSPGGFGAAANLELGLGWMPVEHVGFAAFVSIPLHAARIETSDGAADLSLLLAGGALRFVFTERANRWAPSVDVGVTAVSFKSTGTSSGRLVPAAVSAAAAAPYARFGLALAVTPTFRVHADVLAGVIGQGVSIVFAGTEVATWGKPFVLPSLGADFGWF